MNFGVRNGDNALQADAAPPGHRLRIAAWSLAVFAGSLLVFGATHTIGLAWFDEGLLLQGISLQQEGRMDSSKFLHYSAQYKLLAAISPDSGPNLETIRLIAAALRSATALLIWFIGSRLMPRKWALLPVLIFVVLPGPWHKVVVPFCICLCLDAMLRTLERRTIARACWLGFSLAFAFSMHIYTGIPSLIGWVAVAWLARTTWIFDESGRAATPSILRWFGAFAMTFGACTLILADFIWDISPLTLAGHNAALVGSVGSSSITCMRNIIDGDNTFVILSIYALVLATLAASLVEGLSASVREEGRRWVVICIWIIGLVNLSKWFIRLDVAHLLQNAPPVWILLGFVLYRWRQRLSLPQGESRAGRSGLSKFGFVVFILGVMVMLDFGIRSPNPYVSGIGTLLFEETAPLQHPHGVVRVSPWLATEFTRLTRTIRDNSAPEEPILVCGTPLILHHLAERRSPVQLATFTVPAAWVANSEATVVEAIRAKGTKLIVYEDQPIIPLEHCRLENLAPTLYELIMTDYELIDTVLGWQVRVLRENGADEGDPSGAKADKENT